MKDETKKLLEDIKTNPSSGVSHDAKMARVEVEQIFAIDELTTEVRELKSNLTKYSDAAEQGGKRMFQLTIFLGFIALFQLFIAYKQMKISEEQGVSEKIMQARSIQSAIELCNQDKTLKESGLFEVSTGKPASCEEVFQTYGSNNSIWSKIKKLFVD